MINIIKQGNNVVITSDNPNAFNIGNGELSVPLNTIYYVLDDESDFIQFNSSEEGSILFNGTIGNIQVNGTLVTRDNIITQLDSVFNSATGEGGGGVESVNGLTGAVLLKTINGEEITGSGNIEISGGSGSAGVEYISTSSVPSEWNTFKGGVKLTTGFTTFDEGDAGLDIFVNGNLEDGTEGGSLWFGLRSTNDSLVLSDAGGRVDLQVNPDNFKTINGNSIIGTGDIEISGSSDSAGVEYIGVGENPGVWDTFYDGVKLYTNWIDLNDDNNPETLDVRVAGTLQDGTVNASTLWFGFTSSDNSINLGDYSNRLDLKVNPSALGVNLDTSNSSLNVGSNNSSQLYGTVLLGNNIQNLYNASILIGNGVSNTVGNQSNITINIGNTLMGDANGYIYFWKGSSVEKLQDYVKFKEWAGTQAEYDALGTYDADTIYNIIEG